MLTAVLLKQVEFVCAISGREAERNFVGPADRVHLNNPLDEVALEQAIRIIEERGTDEVWVFCLTKELIRKESERAIAMGADRFVQLWDPAWASLDAWATAQVLSKAIEKVGASLVLCGASSLDLNRGEVGVYVAHQLGIPYVSSVMTLKTREAGLLLQRSLGKGDREELEADYPLCVGVDRRLCEPRYPSRVSLLEAQTKDIVLWQSEDIGMTEQDIELRVRMGPLVTPKPRTKWMPQLDGSLPGSERIEYLLSAMGLEKEGILLEGDSGKLANELLTFFRENRLI